MAGSRRANVLQRPAALPVAAELEALERLDLGQLRVQYRNRTGRIAPARISRSLLLRVLAHQIQVEAFGDFGRDTRRMLDRLVATTTEGQEQGAAASARVEPPAFSIKPGTLLSREWQGRMESVMALEEGFAWNGKAHASLSAVAFAMTGTKWNGHRFFGLRRKGMDPARADDRTKAVCATDLARCAQVASERSGSLAVPDPRRLGARP